VNSEDVEFGSLNWQGDAPRPGIVMIHDVWGLAEHTRDLARRLARDGFAVLAIDLYRREAEVKIENPGVWMRGLSDPQALADVEAAAAWLADQAACTGRVGVLGFCMGGMYALLSACGGAGIAAATAFYGLLSHQHGILYDEAGLDPARKPREPLAAVAELSCPLLCLFGDADEFVPLADIDALRTRLADSAPPSEVVVYPGCGHAFMNDTRDDAYRPETAAVAWQRMLGFLRQHLGS
jgi:carboxymethylenebutenolidase